MKTRWFDFPRPHPHVALAMSLVLLAGCATMTFKRGASPDAMEADERACRNASTDDSAFAECMRRRGWFISTTAEPPDGTAAATVVPPPASTAAPGAPNTAEVTHPAGSDTAMHAVDVDAARPVSVEAARPAAVAAPRAAPVEAAPPAPIAAPEPKAPTTTAKATSPAAADPLARVGVASWWKLGGSAGALDRAIDACVGKLGEAHRPDPGARVVTVGLRACLRADGWYGVGGSSLR